MKKIDKRTKAYRDSLKKSPVTILNNIKKAQKVGHPPKSVQDSDYIHEQILKTGFVITANTETPKSHYEMICELQDWCRSQDERIKGLQEKVSNLENKVG